MLSVKPQLLPLLRSAPPTALKAVLTVVVTNNATPMAVAGSIPMMVRLVLLTAPMLLLVLQVSLASMVPVPGVLLLPAPGVRVRLLFVVLQRVVLRLLQPAAVILGFQPPEPAAALVVAPAVRR